MSFTNFCATLRNYQDAFMYISESRTDLILINHVIKTYEIKHEPLGPIG